MLYGHDESTKFCLNNIGKTPLLKAGEDIKLARIYRANPTSPCGLAAKQKLIVANLRLLVFVAKKYPKAGELLDRIQDGMFGLMIAAERYDPEKGYKFSTYAYIWIRQSICRADDVNGRVVRIPTHQIQSLHTIRKVCAQLAIQNGQKPSVSELAQETKRSPEQVDFTLSSAKFDRGNVLSTNMLVGEERGSELGDLLPDQSQDLNQQLQDANISTKVAEILAVLTPSQRQVLRLSFGFDGDSLNSRQIGDIMGLSRERIRQIRVQALQRINRNPQLKKLARSLL